MIQKSILCPEDIIMADEISDNKLLMIEYYRANPCQASSDLLGIDLAPHQRICLKAMWFCDYTILTLSRGTGKTFMLSLYSVLRALLYPGEKVGIISPTFRQSKFVWAEVEKIYDSSEILRESCSKPPARTPESCYLRFAGGGDRAGSVIEALPLGDGGKIRGARYFSIVCDEVAQIPSIILDIVVRGMMATTKNPMENVRKIEHVKKMREAGHDIADAEITKNKFIMASTAFFQYNHFWERVSKFQQELLRQYKQEEKEIREGTRTEHDVIMMGGDLNNGQIKHRLMQDKKRALVAFKFTDAPQGFMDTSAIQESKRDMSEYMFRMEYEVYFPPDSEGFFRRSMLDKAREHREFCCLDKPREGHIYLMGIDPARASDNFTISIFECKPPEKEIRLVRMIAYNSKDFPTMHKEVRHWIKHYKVAEVAMDSGGGGTTVRDLLAEQALCPLGEDLILQRDFEEHKLKKGRKILTLVEFSRYEWLHSANHAVLSGLQHGDFKIAAIPLHDTVTPKEEEMDEEIEQTLGEMQNIIVTVTQSGRMHWDTPMKHQRKDRYSSVIIGYKLAYDYIESFNKPTSLVSGFWR